MKKPIVKKSAKDSDFESLVVTIVQIHQQAQEFAARAVNVGLTLRNWFIGHRIVEFEQRGADRAAYGEQLLPTLAKRLAAAGLKRVDTRELRRFRLLYTVSPHIRESVTPELLARAGASALQPLLDCPLRAKRETPSPETHHVETVAPKPLPAGADFLHRLSFSHLAELLELNKPQEIKRAGHGVSMLHMTKEKMENLEVMLPPLAEQRRIVAKVEQLMALVVALETHLAASRATAANLLSALVAELITA